MGIFSLSAKEFKDILESRIEVNALYFDNPDVYMATITIDDIVDVIIITGFGTRALNLSRIKSLSNVTKLSFSKDRYKSIQEVKHIYAEIITTRLISKMVFKNNKKSKT